MCSLNFTPGLFTAHRKRFAFHSIVPVSPACGDAARWSERTLYCPGRWNVSPSTAEQIVKVNNRYSSHTGPFTSAWMIECSHLWSLNAASTENTCTLERMEGKVRKKTKQQTGVTWKGPESMFGLNQSLLSSCFPGRRPDCCSLKQIVLLSSLWLTLAPCCSSELPVAPLRSWLLL